MDIIASHQHGLADQLEQEAAGLAGRGGDLVQRAIAYHHVYDHSGARHRYALVAAHAALALDPAIERMRGAARRGRWRIGRARAEALAARTEQFAAALKDIDRARCEALLTAYRLVNRPGLRDAASARLPAAVVEALAGAEPRELYMAHVHWAEARWGMEIEGALAALAWPLAGRGVVEAVAAVRLSADHHDQFEARGWGRAEADLRASKRMPDGFAANPGQHYYKMQRAIAERRRKVAELDLPVSETVVLAVAA